MQSKLQIQQKFDLDSSTQSSNDSNIISENSDERRLPWPGGIRENDENMDLEKKQFSEELFKNKSLEFYKYLSEKIAELKFNFGELLENNETFNKSTYLTYLYVFLILFSFGIGVGFLRNNFKKPFQDSSVSDNQFVISNKKLNNDEKNIFKENKNKDTNTKEIVNISSNKINSSEIKVLSNALPSLEEIKYLISTWLTNKSSYLAGKSELNISKIVQDGLINRTIQQRESDIKKGIYKEINSQIKKINITSQTSSRIVVLVELSYLEKIRNISGELINETSLSPLKVRYILGFTGKSWKLVDFISGV